MHVSVDGTPTVLWHLWSGRAWPSNSLLCISEDALETCGFLRDPGLWVTHIAFIHVQMQTQCSWAPL